MAKKLQISEQRLHAFWQKSRYFTRLLLTSSKHQIEIIHRGKYNRDAGPDFIGAVVKIDNKLYEIRKDFYGDNLAGQLDMGTKTPPATRIGYLTGEMWESTSSPTQTQRDALKLAGDAFLPILARIKAVMDQDLEQLKRKLEKAGAPYTPGREVDWSKN